MTRRLPHYTTKLYQYLKEKGLLGSDTQTLQAAKHAYYRQQNREYKKQRRKDFPEVTVSLSKGQHQELKAKADHYHLSLASFLREATLTYCQQRFLVPNAKQVAQVEQRLVHLQTDVSLLRKHADQLSLQQVAQGYQALVTRLATLEGFVSDRLREPARLDHRLIKELQANSSFVATLRLILNRYDSQS